VTRKLEDLVDLEGLDARSLERLEGVHQLLVEAGPPPELTPALELPPDGRAGGGKVVPFRRRRSGAAGLAFAAAIAAACFGGGFLLGHGSHSGMNVVKVAQMQGEQRSLASLQIGHADANGNWPIEFTVTGLPKLGSSKAFYILMLEQNGEPRYPCGTFRVVNGKTTVRFSVPYPITKSSRWVVTSMAPGRHFPGHVVMTTI
jgi:hypothetical protein